MKFTMPAARPAGRGAAAVLSQSLFTVDQQQYAILFQLGEIIETMPNAGLYFKVAAAAERQVTTTSAS